MAWIDALCGVHGMTDDDAERVTKAFRIMSAQIEQWPAPATLMKHLPELPRPYFHALPKSEMTLEQVMDDRERRREVLRREYKRLIEAMRGKYEHSR